MIVQSGIALATVSGGTELKYLNVSGCPLIDDWCLDCLGQEFADSLLLLDLSECPQVTEKGLASLHKLK